MIRDAGDLTRPYANLLSKVTLGTMKEQQALKSADAGGEKLDALSILCPPVRIFRMLSKVLGG